ncbi:MAG: hypothetical protein P4L84_14930 [Isosphaeraceae bacterium]|nr:hypothetical protein [Isosphaeraceae bacterium]
MTAERRLVALETSLSPTQLVLRWLAEAHQYDDFDAYSRAIFALGPGALPLDRLVREARASAEAASQHGSREQGDDALRAAIRRIVFLFHLVLRAIELAQAALDREALVCTALSAHLGLVMADEGRAWHSVFPNRAAGLTALRDGAVARSAELRALEAARKRVETRYLDGYPALFPATVRTWTEQRERTDTLAEITVRLAELEGLAPMPANDPDTFEARVGELIADHVEPARVKALDEMGEGRRAVSIAMAWLEPKLG